MKLFATEIYFLTFIYFSVLVLHIEIVSKRVLVEKITSISFNVGVDNCNL